MTTIAKILANRRNGKLSTGPVSPEGKAIVARNAVRHGVFANIAVVTGESPDAWETHRAGVVESLAPVGLLETTLAERVALLLWRLARLAKYEAATTGAAVEDAGLPPPAIDPLTAVMGRTGGNREEHLKWTSNQYRAVRESLAILTEMAGIVGRLGSGDETGPVAGERVHEILGYAASVAYDRPVRRYDPEHPSSEALLPTLGLPAGSVWKATWTTELLQRAVTYYADAVGRPLGEFVQEVLDALDERIAAFAREVYRLKGEMTALTRRLEHWRDRAADAALLPPVDVVERVVKYEKHLHATLTSTLNQLERLQAHRVGAAVVPPVVADLQVTVNHEIG